jgi:hypothetical protein
MSNEIRSVDPSQAGAGEGLLVPSRFRQRRGEEKRIVSISVSISPKLRAMLGDQAERLGASLLDQAFDGLVVFGRVSLGEWLQHQPRYAAFLIPSPSFPRSSACDAADRY